MIAQDVGISRISQDNPLHLTVWPNPATHLVNMSAVNLNSQTKTLMIVTDILGKAVLQYDYQNKTELKESIDMSALSKGLYFIKISNDNRQAVYRIQKE